MMVGKNRSRGFTLLELILVIVLLGVLAAVSAPRFFDISSKANEIAAEGMMVSIRSGLVFYKVRWEISGRSTAVSGYSMVANSNGVATGILDDGIAHEADCDLIWQELIQDGPAIAFISGINGWEGTFSGDKWGRSASQLPSETQDIYCHFVYTHGSGNAPMVVYNIMTGELTTDTWPFSR